MQNHVEFNLSVSPYTKFMSCMHHGLKLVKQALRACFNTKESVSLAQQFQQLRKENLATEFSHNVNFHPTVDIIWCVCAKSGVAVTPLLTNWACFNIQTIFLSTGMYIIKVRQSLNHIFNGQVYTVDNQGAVLISRCCLLGTGISITV